MEEHLTSFLISNTNEQISYILTNNNDYPIDPNDNSVEHALEFKEHDLQENFWNIDEVEDCFTKEQLVLKHPDTTKCIDEEEPSLFTEKTRDYSNEAQFNMFLRRKRILRAVHSVVKDVFNIKVSNKNIQKPKRPMRHNKNNFDLTNDK